MILKIWMWFGTVVGACISLVLTYAVWLWTGVPQQWEPRAWNFAIGYLCLMLVASTFIFMAWRARRAENHKTGAHMIGVPAAVAAFFDSFSIVG